MRASSAAVASMPALSAPQTMVRSFSCLYGSQSLPTRGPAKNGTCRSPSQMAKANGKQTAAANGKKIRATAMSNTRFASRPATGPLA